ncbi:unnamed protein product [Rangifer tarandus platyrhynchus]|uniref:Uncharacterized protein n=2 Tax=Rangifer tarandus platyrhynchus TaxID=3082113 RepID=A0ABN8ZA59_RANTA|nr:unnamed protein product [Rangifer tarandus platyrhynchus]
MRVLKAPSLCQDGQLYAMGEAVCHPPMSARSALKVIFAAMMVISPFRQRAAFCVSNIWALSGFRFDGEPGIPILWKLIFKGLGVLKCPSLTVRRMQVGLAQ